MDKPTIALILSIIAVILAAASYMHKRIPGEKGEKGDKGETPLMDKLCINDKCLKENDINRLNSIFPSSTQYINIVNRRPIIGVGSRMVPAPVSGTETQPQLLFNEWTYNPFGYNVPPPAPGATRRWRIYGVYSDTLTGGPGPVLQFNIGAGDNWSRVVETVKFIFPITWGGVSGETRDAYSDIVKDPQNKMHSLLYSYIPTDATGTKSVRWTYAELQALDVYE